MSPRCDSRTGKCKVWTHTCTPGSARTRLLCLEGFRRPQASEGGVGRERVLEVDKETRRERERERQ